MDTTELLQIYDQELRIDTDFPGVQREVSGRVIRSISPDENFGFIAYSTLEEDSAQAEIEAQIARFQELGMSFEWKVYDHDRPADLRQRLSARGFEIEDPEALMVLDLEEAPDFYWTLSLPPIQCIDDAGGIEQIRQLEETVWGTDHSWLNTRLTNDLRNPQLLSVFGVCAESQVVSAAWIYYHPPSRFGSLWGGTTLPEYRRRGYYTGLLVARAREARERGYHFLTVDASPMSRPILEKHGFQFLGFSTPCVWRVQPAVLEG